MLFKLSMPIIDRASQSGTILRWHKQPGDVVAFGDDVLDLRVELQHKPPEQPWLGRLAARWRGESTPKVVHKVEWRRMVSAESGILRRIYAPAGAAWQPGDLLAVLTDTPDELWSDDLAILSQAAAFRVVTNRLDPT